MFFFFFNDPATTEIYPLSLHDALPISSSRRRGPPASTSSTRCGRRSRRGPCGEAHPARCTHPGSAARDRKSTRLNSSHSQISYAVFCLKKKKKRTTQKQYIKVRQTISE